MGSVTEVESLLKRVCRKRRHKKKKVVEEVEDEEDSDDDVSSRFHCMYCSFQQALYRRKKCVVGLKVTFHAAYAREVTMRIL